MSAGDQPVALITGSARRIGAAIAREFHQQGCRVIIHCHRSSQEAAALQASFEAARPGSAHWISADLNDPAAVIALAEKSLARFGRLDTLVNNASTFYATELGQISEGDWIDLMNSNARAPLFLCQALAEPLRQAHGSIINLADINASRGMAKFSAYTMAKAALQAMTRSLARELAPDIRVNSVSPGAILWPTHANDPVLHAEAQAAILAGIPLGRLGMPEDIARTVFFLAHQASYVTGQVIRVDGGRGLNGQP